VGGSVSKCGDARFGLGASKQANAVPPSILVTQKHPYGVP